MAINFPNNPVLDELFTDISGVEWKCIDATVGDVQWARTSFSPPQNYIGKNYIINPTFIINQREFAGGNLDGNVYGFDRWKAFNASATMDVVDGVATIVGDIGQVIEDFGYVGPMTLSWKGTATAQGTGETSPLTFNKTAGITSVQFSDGTLSEVKLEIGSVVTPFEYPDIGTELDKCQRYFYRNKPRTFLRSPFSPYTLGYAVMAYMSFPVTMRTDIPKISWIPLPADSSPTSGWTEEFIRIDTSANGFSYLIRNEGVANGNTGYYAMEEFTADAEL